MNLTNFLTSPLQHFKAISIKSVRDVIQSDSKPLSVISKENGEEKTIHALNVILIDLCNYFSVGKGMGAEQVKETSRLLLAKYNRLKIEDLKLFSDYFKSGYYGKSYDRIDGQVILIALDEYFEDRIKEAERLNFEKHKEAITDKGEYYFVQIANEWARLEDGECFTEPQKELATLQTFEHALELKTWLLQQTKLELKIVDSRKAGSLYDYLAQHKPELLPRKERFRRATSDYHIQKQAILNDDSLSELEKENKVRELAGIEPLTIEQFIAQQNVYLK
jgi:hypothetical protein